MMEKKYEFSEIPSLIEYEGNIVRINFDIEENTYTDTEDRTNRTVYLAYVVRLEQPLTEIRIKEAVMSEGFDEYKADEVAAMVMTEQMKGFGNSAKALEYAKKTVIARINQYDNSDDVNQFMLNGNPMWLDDATRTKLKKRFETDEEDNKTETRVIYNGIVFDLPIVNAKSMLHQLESYARDCFDKTNEHKAIVSSLNNINDVISYNYTTGYPEKLVF